MENPSTTSTLRRWINGVLIGLFVVLMWLPSLDSIFQLDWTPKRSENRAMAVFPKFQPGGAGVQAFLVGLEAYFNDHFGYRKCLVQWNNKLKWFVFQDKNSNVIIGKNGWLFPTDAEMVDHYSGQLQFTPEQLHDWQVLLEKRRDWLAKRGIAYLFVMAPDKQTIYPEELPAWVVKVNPQTKVDQFFAYMKEHSTVPVLDLRNVVRDGKQLHPTYLQTDTHWNFFGGFLAYQELVRRMAPLVPALKLEPMPLSSFTLTNLPQPAGDVAKLLGLSVTESNGFVLTPKPGLPKFTSKMSPPDQPKEPKFTDNPNVKGRMIIFQDSFAMCWFPFLGYNFNEVVYLWQYDFDPAWIEREKPDIVVNEMLERFFNIKDPKKLMTQESLD